MHIIHSWFCYLLMLTGHSREFRSISLPQDGQTWPQNAISGKLHQTIFLTRFRLPVADLVELWWFWMKQCRLGSEIKYKCFPLVRFRSVMIKEQNARTERKIQSYPVSHIAHWISVADRQISILEWRKTFSRHRNQSNIALVTRIRRKSSCKWSGTFLPVLWSRLSVFW